VQEDFINWNPEKCRELILRYQKTQDNELYTLLLAKYDRYLISLVSTLKRRYKYLRNEPLIDLYHTAIIGFSKALTKLKPVVTPGLVIHVIKAYVKAEIRKEFESRKYEMGKEIEESMESRNSFKEFTKMTDSISVHLITSSSVLTKSERLLLSLRFSDDLTLREISDKTKKSPQSVHYAIKQILKKLHSRIVKFRLGN